MSGPPDKFGFVDLTSVTTPTDRATALSNAYSTFYATYGVWPNAIVSVGSVVYFGAY